MAQTGNRLIILMGVRGIGKTFLINKITEYLSQIKIIKTTTTRPQKDTNDDIFHYFISADEFRQKAETGWFIETDEYLGYWYGSSVHEIFDVLEKNHGIMALTKNGVISLFNNKFLWAQLKPLVLLLKPVNPNVLRINLASRGIKNKEEQDKHIREVFNCVLPPEIPHKTITLTRTKSDRDRVLLPVMAAILPIQ